MMARQLKALLILWLYNPLALRTQSRCLHLCEVAGKIDVILLPGTQVKAADVGQVSYTSQAGGRTSYDEWVGGDRLKVRGKPLKKAAPPKPERPPLEFTMGYWAIRGLGAPLRMMFEYRGAKYTDNQYTSSDKWFQEDKPKLLEKNPLANLSYVTCGSDVVSQSNACLSYVGSRLRLNGAGNNARLQNEQLVCEIFDIRNKMMGLSYPFAAVCRDGKEHKAKSVEHLESNPFSKFEAVLSKGDTDFFSSKGPCTADFHIWEMMDQERLLAEKHGVSDIFAKALPQLEKYFASDSYKLPCNNKGGNAYFV
jgi:glutathione S-transferase